jgi:Effector-associated domain 1
MRVWLVTGNLVAAGSAVGGRSGDGRRLEALRDALRGAFDLNSLDQMLLFGLNYDRTRIRTSADLNTVLFHVIAMAIREGWLDDLVREASKYVPNNSALREIAATELGPPSAQSKDRTEYREDQIKDTVQELFALLVVCGQAFQAQARLRNQLVDRFKRRLGISSRLEYEEFFRRHYDNFDAEELERHRVIRGYTTELLAMNNALVLELPKQLPHAVYVQIPSLTQLRSHLEIWLAKLRAVFVTSPWMSVLYVGVGEGVPFPSQVEVELANFLEPNRGAFGISAANSAEPFEEHRAEGCRWSYHEYKAEQLGDRHCVWLRRDQTHSSGLYNRAVSHQTGRKIEGVLP